jgi:hypothetical protein
MRVQVCRSQQVWARGLVSAWAWASAVAPKQVFPAVPQMAVALSSFFQVHSAVQVELLLQPASRAMFWVQIWSLTLPVLQSALSHFRQALLLGREAFFRIPEALITESTTPYPLLQ